MLPLRIEVFNMKKDFTTILKEFFFLLIKLSQKCLHSQYEKKYKFFLKK